MTPKTHDPRDVDDILAIQALKARYARFGDTKDWPAFRACLAEDYHCLVTGAPRASADHSDAYEVHGADAFVANAMTMVADIQPIHQLSLPEIVLTSGATATGIWALHDLLIAPHCIFRGWGHYHDAYVKVGGSWKIRKSIVTRIRVEETWLRSGHAISARAARSPSSGSNRPHGGRW